MITIHVKTAITDHAVGSKAPPDRLLLTERNEAPQRIALGDPEHGRALHHNVSRIGRVNNDVPGGIDREIGTRDARRAAGAITTMTKLRKIPVAATGGHADISLLGVHVDRVVQ